MPRIAAPTLSASASTSTSSSASASKSSPIPRVSDRDRRRTSASVILRSVLEHGPVARSTIARLTGLSPASVTDHCARLAELGFVREATAPRRSNGVGRPHVPLDMDNSRFVVGGVHVAVPYTTVALLDLRGRVVAERELKHSGAPDPYGVLARAADGLGALLDAAPAAGRSVSASPRAAGWTGTPGPSSSIRCWAGARCRCGRCSAHTPGCRSMWTGTRGRW